MRRWAGDIPKHLIISVCSFRVSPQVYFSDPIVVRFGREELADRGTADRVVMGSLQSMREEQEKEEGEANDDKESDLEAREEGDIPCPSLEFRLVNRLHGVPSGEIVEAKLECVAILDPKIAQLSSQGSSNERGETDSVINADSTVAELITALREQDRPTTSLAFHSADSKEPRVFTRLTLDADEHPYFRRVWFGRHRLDEHSPLLTRAARQRVKANGGSWPADMNDYHSIKSSLHFHHILVCISGTSNANAADVFAQKVYDLVDVNFGYRFVPMNYHGRDGGLRTDPYLLNAVYQQRGGGGEPFM